MKKQKTEQMDKFYVNAPLYDLIMSEIKKAYEREAKTQGPTITITVNPMPYQIDAIRKKYYG